MPLKTKNNAKELAIKLVFAIATFFGYESAKEIFKAERTRKNNEAKLMVLRGAYPDISKELEENPRSRSAKLRVAEKI